MITFIMKLLGYKPVKTLSVKHLLYLSKIFGGCIIEIGFAEDWDNSVQTAFVFGKRASRKPLHLESVTLTPSYRIILDGVLIQEHPCFHLEYKK